jgi:hypothetical protein
MGWFFRKSLRALPGVRINLSKSGPRLSVGVRGARASFGADGKTRLYAAIGPLRYQKTVTVRPDDRPITRGGGLLGLFRGLFGR